MAERRDDAGFALEAREGLRVRGEPLGEHLDRDVALQPGVARAIHLAHPAGADRGDHFVGTEPSAGREGHWSRADYRRASGLS